MAAEKLQKKKTKKKTFIRNSEEPTDSTNSLLFQEESSSKDNEGSKKKRSSRSENRKEGRCDKVDQPDIKGKGGSKKKKSSVSRHTEGGTDKVDQSDVETKNSREAVGPMKRSRMEKKKKRMNYEKVKTETCEANKHQDEMEDGLEQNGNASEAGKIEKTKSGRKKGKNQIKPEVSEIDNNEVGNESEFGKPSKAHKFKRDSHMSSKKRTNSVEKKGEAEDDDVYEISSGDEDSSKGMRKWIDEYQRRPGLKELQEKIDEFITAHEEKEEQARKEREARAAEGGWTVVVHHKGRKKTTDSETGITVGSVAAAAVVDKMTKKKSKEMGLDFYRFQKREAQRNEIMMLQSKFEQDKKRIQELRAQRKFRPY